MSRKIICIRLKDEDYDRLQTLERTLGLRTSGTVRAAISMALMQTMVDKGVAMRYDEDDLPEPSSEAVESGAELPPSVPGLPPLDPLPPCPKCGRGDCPPGFHCRVPRSRSQQRRIAAQCGESEPSPVITAEGTITPAAPDTTEMSADELDAWVDKLMKGTP